MRNVEITHLRYFVAVAEELSFSRAATRLHMSQPPLSQRIKALEDELGVQLLARNRRDVQLTEAGKIFLNESRHILEHLGQAVGATIRAGTSDGGGLKVGFVTSALFHLLPLIKARLAARFPDVQMLVHDMSSRDQVEALLQERLDVGVIHACPAVAGLNKFPVYSEPFVLALPQGHELAGLQSIEAVDLEKYPLIGFSRETSPSLHDAQMACCLSKGMRPSLVHQVRTPLAIFQLIQLGMGISLVPKAYSRSTYPGVVFKDLKESAGHLHLYVVWKDGVKSALTRKVIDEVMLHRFTELD
ncbi:LysR family transcriptional regulator [Bordetella genomosp. 9]|uniref:LysR family transcriptional regulator n=1 Tax=Bordetella genomosp. 9 TaxID=1416803 RepID=A0A261RFM0_9BORD|nr:LysR family transcriptional regulator [Bordetella genomosp. 9]OZI23819.1 LysR family transcriptional regulator [Bordetella genomosp. 9]